MYLLDTDTLSHLHAGHPGVVQHMQETSDLEVATTVVTRIEILRARFEFLLKAADGEQLLRAQHWLNRSEELLQQLTVIGIDDKAAEMFERLQKRKKLKRIGRADLLIASISLAQQAILVTRNVRHFRQITNLKAENWVDDN